MIEWALKKILLPSDEEMARVLLPPMPNPNRNIQVLGLNSSAPSELVKEFEGDDSDYDSSFNEDSFDNYGSFENSDSDDRNNLIDTQFQNLKTVDNLYSTSGQLEVINFDKIQGTTIEHIKTFNQGDQDNEHTMEFTSTYNPDQTLDMQLAPNQKLSDAEYMTAAEVLVTQWYHNEAGSNIYLELDVETKYETQILDEIGKMIKNLEGLDNRGFKLSNFYVNGKAYQAQVDEDSEEMYSFNNNNSYSTALSEFNNINKSRVTIIDDSENSKGKEEQDTEEKDAEKNSEKDSEKDSEGYSEEDSTMVWKPMHFTNDENTNAYSEIEMQEMTHKHNPPQDNLKNNSDMLLKVSEKDSIPGPKSQNKPDELKELTMN